MNARSSMKDKLTITVVGRSGCGKGTQAKFILQKLGKRAHRVETGKIFRAIMRKNNPTVAKIRRVVDAGWFAPSWVSSFLWIKELIEHGYGDKHLIFDGSPRKLPEARMMDEVIRWHGRPLPVAIYIRVDAKEATRRLFMRARLEGRADDSPQGIKNRMKSFSRDVRPVIRYYQRHGRLITADGSGTPDEVRQEIDRALARRFGRLWPRR